MTSLWMKYGRWILFGLHNIFKFALVTTIKNSRGLYNNSATLENKSEKSKLSHYDSFPMWSSPAGAG